MDNWNPMHSTTVQEIEEYMKSLGLHEKHHQKGANDKQVAGSHYSDKSIRLGTTFMQITLAILRETV